MAMELKRRGHDVTVFTFIKGLTTDHLEVEGIKVTTAPEGAFDLILCNHCTCLPHCHRLKGYTIFTGHGPGHQLEQPTKGADRYVAVSAETRSRHLMLGYDSALISNGVDLEEFKPFDPRNVTPVVLSLAKHQAANAMMAEAARNQGFEFRSFHYMEKPIWDVDEEMKQADIVVGCGRTAIEALACGKQVLVFDCRNPFEIPMADGWIREGNVDRLRMFNFSCRANAYHVTTEDLEKMLYNYRNLEPYWQRSWAEEHADIRKKADDYLDMM